MKCEWDTDRNAPTPCRVIDLDTGKVIPLCAKADEETGEYEQYVTVPGKDGRPIYVIDPETKKVRRIRGKTRLEIQYLGPIQPNPGP